VLLELNPGSAPVPTIVATEASKEMISLHRFMDELGKKQENSRLYYDN
jgi:hypothetical protein